ncbi:tetratricopeptide repeat protein [Oceanibacterium hippocampi]|uniref:Anaphase-promoting complex, cyclosome, subunit 3 n=1 Tax=Oceanibacterium hippocampi TaxID=745714 RepID=A0A1Y5U225_9PROT|nr:tetratricopeptide repeat protein [Oceanibacterium hippocampi]SLN77121.1 Anaphase-promoting complex, cyclosome, subunit 3 [Oceanibacterium hippocampi]
MAIRTLFTRLSLALLALTLLAGATLAEPARIAVRAWAHDGHGRIAFQWASAEPYRAAIEEGGLVVRFDHPFTADYGSVTDQLGSYVTGVVPGEDGRSVRFELTGDFRVRSESYDNVVAIDLLPATEVKAAATPPVRTVATGAPAAEAASPPRVAVRRGEHDAYSRLVFDWPRKVEYETMQEGDRVTIRFAAPASLDLSEVNRDLPAFVGRLSAQSGADGSETRFAVPEGSDLRHFRLGNKIVVDVMRPKPGAGNGKSGTGVEERRAAAPQPSTAAASKPSAAPKPDVAADTGAGKPAAMPAAPPAAKPAARPSTLPVVESPRAPAHAAPAPAPRNLLADTDVQGASAAAPSSLPSDLPTVVIEPERRGDATRLVFAWHEATGLAAFERGGNWYFVFDRKAIVDDGEVRAGYGSDIVEAEQVAHGGATVVRIRATDKVYPEVSRRDFRWIADFLPTPAPPLGKVIDVKPQPRAEGGPEIFFPVTDAAPRVSFTDPEVGDTIIAVPLLSEGPGVATGRAFTQFEVLPSRLGVAMAVRADDLAVEVAATGVRVTARDGLLLSRTAAASAFEMQAESGGGTIAMKPSLLKLAEWRRDGAGPFNLVRQDLQRALALAPEGGRAAARMDLAKFYLGHRFYADALGVLERLVAKSRDVALDPVYLAMRGLAEYGLGRYEEARQIFDRPAFDDIPEIGLWRAAVSARLKDWTAARLEFATGADAMPVMDPESRIAFTLQQVEAMMQLDEPDRAEATLDILERDEKPFIEPRQRSWINLARGRLAFLDGAFDEARERLDATIAGVDRKAAVEARLEKVKLREAMNEITPEEKAAELEGLRFTWRGDDFERHLLVDLGEHYIAEHKYAEGLNTLRQAVGYFPKSSETQSIARRMSEVFTGLYVSGEADSLPPIQALGLYYDFQELTPVGRAGDEMVRRLAERLVSVDLLGNAADLLQHQVKYRLKGAEQSEVAARLAVIYLLDRQASSALEVLRTTNNLGLEAPIRETRAHLEARALVDLERYGEALSLLRNDASHEAQMLRADVHWRSRDWAAAEKAYQALLGERWNDESPLDRSDLEHVMKRAVALSMANDWEALAELRGRYGPLLHDTPESDAFEVITAQVNRDETDFRQLASSIAQVNRLEAFMTNYRQQLERGGLFTPSEPNT